MKNYQNYTQKQGINTVFQYLAFLHTPEITVFLPAMIKQGFENVVNRLGMYERLLDKLASEKLSASQIETEILKVAMLYNRNRMSNLYYS